MAGAVFCFVVCLLRQDFVSAIACDATGLDAMQLLEQKKTLATGEDGSTGALEIHQLCVG